MKRLIFILSAGFLLLITFGMLTLFKHSTSNTYETTHSASATPVMETEIMWVTDTHLTQSNQAALFNAIQSNKHKAIFITGDISNDDLIANLTYISSATTSPIYFILGNSDTNYGHNTQQIRQQIKQLCKEVKNLHYLHDHIVYNQPTDPKNNNKVAIIGFDGYADSWKNVSHLLEADLEKLQSNIKTAIKNNCEWVVILSHVPPFQSDCLYQGKPTTPQFAPHYSSTQFANLLLDLARDHQHVTFIVYAGQTHNENYKTYPQTLNSSKEKGNLHVFVGKKFQSNDLSSIYKIDPQLFFSKSLQTSIPASIKTPS